MKKNFAVFCTAIIALSASADLLAQTRGANYNPPSRGGGSSSPTSRPSSSPSAPTPSRGSNYNPPSSSGSNSTASSRPSQSQPSQPSQPSRGSNYNPPSSSGSGSSPTYTSRPTPSQPSQPSQPGRGSNYNPPTSSPGSNYPSSPAPTYTSRPSQPTQTSPSGVPRGPRYNPPVSSGSQNYQIPSHQQGRVTVYRPVYHVPQVINYTTIRYSNYRDYAVHVDHRYIYRNWIQEPVIFSYSNGYWMMDSYPYYVHRGFRYRYHPVEQCRYQLVDSSSYSSVTNYSVRACSIAYDQCAFDRDNMNRNLYSDRYFCAENVDYDLASSNDYDWNPYANDINYSEQASIDNYLYGKSFLDIFYDAQSYGVGNCRIQVQPSYYNNYSNEYVVKAGSYSYPEVDGSVTSSTANLIGCYVGSAEENAGCILKAAIQEGYCL